MRVIIADDSALFREGLKYLLTELGIEVLAAVDTVDELLRAVVSFEPDLVIVDVRMPPTFTDEGSRAAASLLAIQSGPAVLLLSQSLETATAGYLASRHTRGFGYLLKDRVTNAKSLVEALRKIVSGGTALDPDFVQAILTRRAARRLVDVLTEREQEVLALIAEGLANAAIAERLRITPKTLEHHVSSIFVKLELAPEDALHRRVAAVLQWLGREPAAGW